MKMKVGIVKNDGLIKLIYLLQGQIIKKKMLSLVIVLQVLF